MRTRKLTVIILVMLMLSLTFSVASAAGKPVKITAPLNGETVSGVYVVTGTGKGAAVEVSIDGGPWSPATGTKNWTYNWDTTAESDGAHTITAQYTDASSSDTANVTVSNGGGSGARPPVAGEVLINEFVAAPSVTETSEWIELYNTTAEELTIGDMWIDDLAGAGSAPQQIPSGTTIQPGDFYVHVISGTYLNNGGDDVRLLSSDQATVHDSYTYASATADKSWCRDTDGGAWRVIECDTTQGSTNSPPLPPGTWTPGNLEIHVLDIGQGESQLIIGPTGRTLLIGVYESNWNTNQGAAYVASEIRRITGSSHLDYVMASHWHLDHMGYATYGGIWSLLEEQGITADVLVDRDGGVWDDTNGDNICDPDTEVVWHNAGTVSGTARNWVCWVTDPTTIGGQIRELAVLGSTTQIDLGLSSGVEVEIVQVDADGVMQIDGVTPVAGDHTADALPPSENDYSFTLWLRWGQFDFVAGGDSDGEYATSEFGYTYNDIETSVAQRINQEVEVIWVNHHGSSHSSSPNYVSTLSPAVSIFSCGSTNTYGHPGQNVLDNFNAEGTQMYFTEPCDPTRNYYNAVIVNDEVVVKTSNGVDYTVNGDAYVASDPAPPSGPRPPVVGEVLINEYLPAPSTWPHEFVELYNTTNEVLVIGGMWIDDIVGGGSGAQQIPAGTEIQPGDYYVHTLGSYLNNSGDDVTLLGSDGTTVHDATSYSSTSYDVSYCRQPDGGSWTSGCTPTEGSAN